MGPRRAAAKVTFTLASADSSMRPDAGSGVYAPMRASAGSCGTTSNLAGSGEALRMAKTAVYGWWRKASPKSIDGAEGERAGSTQSAVIGSASSSEPTPSMSTSMLSRWRVTVAETSSSVSFFFPCGSTAPLAGTTWNWRSPVGDGSGSGMRSANRMGMSEVLCR